MIAFLDLSSNGTLGDEAALLTGLAAVIAAATGTIVALLRREVRAHNSKLQEVADTLNHVDEECATDGQPTIGQRVVRIERQVDTMNDSILDLTTAMTQHIMWEEKKATRIDQRLTDVEATLAEVRDCVAKHHPEAVATTPTRRRRKT